MNLKEVPKRMNMRNKPESKKKNNFFEADNFSKPTSCMTAINKTRKDIMRSPLKRFEGNPILIPENMPFDCYSIFNAGAVIFEGQVLLLLRVEDSARKVNFYTAKSDDGINFTVASSPINYPTFGIEKSGRHSTRFDMRITPLDGVFYVCHALWIAPWGCCIAMAKTVDFVNFDHISTSVPSNRNAVLFPEKINDKYIRFERPMGGSGTSGMWITESPDLIHWGNPRPIAIPFNNWSQKKRGAGCMPIKTPYGWLEIYHATSLTASSENYYLGVCLLDLDDPSKVIAAPDKFILAAEKDYECVGQVPNVVFTGGAVEKDRKLLLYYGGADTRMCLAETTRELLLNWCLDNK